MNEKKQKKPVEVDPVLAAAEAAQKAAEAEERQKRAEAVATYDKNVRKMSNCQLRGELRRAAKKPADLSPLTAGLASILLIMMDNSKYTNPKSRMEPYPR